MGYFNANGAYVTSDDEAIAFQDYEQTQEESTMANDTFDKWLNYYTERFANMSNDSLKGYWYMYGRDSEENAPPRDMAAWSAVNYEMQNRRL